MPITYPSYPLSGGPSPPYTQGVFPHSALLNFARIKMAGVAALQILHASTEEVHAVKNNYWAGQILNFEYVSWLDIFVKLKILDKHGHHHESAFFRSV